MFPLSTDDEIFQLRIAVYNYLQYTRELFLFGIIYGLIITSIILLAVCYTAAQVCLTFYRTTLPKDALVKEARVVSRPPGKTAVIHEYVHQDYGKIYDNGDDDDEDTDDETSFLNPSLN
ncbi:MAG: hypothetical protein V2I33_17385 [Kangiellaceae bacterium]|jgi:hypothetical protein|nr:hypothetical protein [Kangiellaceae bacterium]